MMPSLTRWLDSPRTPAVAGLISLVLGLFFTFVWAPHPWGWQGIDAYHELARSLARGEPFATTDVPWGYSYYIAFFYALFGERLWPPLLGQVIANSFVPLLLYRLARPYTDQRTATLASLLVGIFSFNTVYASTQASDAICTVLFLCAMVTFSRGCRLGDIGAFALSGVLWGLVPQFRPNLVILPAVLIGLYAIWIRFSLRGLTRATVFCALVLAMQLPWIVRNYQLTGLLLPTSTHGGVQLWYGTLQVGPYLERRAANPRTAFESPAFDYASLTDASLMIDAAYRSCFPGDGRPELVYWTAADPRRHRVAPIKRDPHDLRFEIPAQPMPSTVYYYFEETGGDATRVVTTPLAGDQRPWVVFVNADHLGDLDTRDDLLDIFDIGRMMRHLAWGEPLRVSSRLDLDGDGRISDADLAAAIVAVLPTTLKSPARAPGSMLSWTDQSVTLELGDGSHVTMPRDFAGRQSDFGVDGEYATALVSSRRSFAAIARPDRRLVPGECTFIDVVSLNKVFYRREPHLMQRYLALASDNISRDPMAFAAASAYRAVRLFIIMGTDDRATAQQFRWSSVAYGLGTFFSAVYFAIFLAGLVVAVRRRSALVLFVVPIVYVPLTICFVLTNMRYTVTMQPLMFMFVAFAVTTALRLAPPAGGNVRSENY
jgi:hypothetical protein